MRLPEPFYFKNSPQAVLLLHAYTGSSNDMRMLGRRLQKAGYTVYAPIFAGHATADALDILSHGSPAKWHDDTEQALQQLQQDGYDQIVPIGLSMGGVYAIRALEEHPALPGGAALSAPVVRFGHSNVPEAFVRYAERLYASEHMDDTERASKEAAIRQNSPAQIEALRAFEAETADRLASIQQPVFIAAGTEDEMIDAEAVNLLGKALVNAQLTQKTYEGASHVLTVNSAHKQLEEDLLVFLDKLFK